MAVIQRLVVCTMWMGALLCALPVDADSISSSVRRAQMDPDVKYAAKQIGMNEEVTAGFNRIVNDYVNDLISGLKKIIRNNSTKFERKIRQKNKLLVKSMDAQMAELLNEQQLPHYEVYRDTFQQKLKLDCESLRC